MYTKATHSKVVQVVVVHLPHRPPFTKDVDVLEKAYYFANHYVIRMSHAKDMFKYQVNVK